MTELTIVANVEEIPLASSFYNLIEDLA